MATRTIISTLFIFISLAAVCQDTSGIDKALAIPGKVFAVLDKKTSSIESKLAQGTERYLSKLERQEARLRRKLWKKDSLLAQQVFGNVHERYEQLRNTSATLNTQSSVYSSRLDSLSTALNFLKGTKLPSAKNEELDKTLAHYKDLQAKLNATEQIKRQLQQRQQFLKEQFQRLGMVKQLKQFRKQVYYYQAQIKEYKALFEDPNKLERKLLELVMKTPQFKDFFARNSVLGSLFALPGSSGTSTASLAGLQTRAMVSQGIIDRFGSSATVTQQLRGNMQQAQGQLQALKNKAAQYSSGSYGNASSDIDMPDGFRPRALKTKTFLQRLEYGANIQSQKARYYFPVTSDLALSLGYKLKENGSVVGVGAGYKLGWGRGWEHINITHQGIALRSYIDWKIKGSLFISGGYEQNYRTLFNSVEQLRNYSAWQSSGLIGLSKKYRVSKKINGEMKILWDFLSYQQIPHTQAILFRVGYNLK